MPEIRALIADDEPLARRGVRQLLEPHGDIRVVGEAGNGREAVELIRTLQPDLLFLDVQMPELNGFAVLARRGLVDIPAIVFLTAHEDFAVRAFDVDATDYLVKPVERSRFEAAVRRARERIRHARGAQGTVPAAAPGIVVHTRAGDHILRPEEIDWIEAADYYATVHAAGRRFLVRTPLATLERQLPAGLFMRVHRSALINLARVRSILDEPEPGAAVVLRTGATVPVSRRRRAGLRAWLSARA